MPRLLNAKGSGPYANHATPLELDTLARYGLILVSGLDANGKVVSETVIPIDDCPPELLAPHARPERACGACHQDAWRPDRGTGQGWVCGRCHL